MSSLMIMLAKALSQEARHEMGAIAIADVLQWVNSLPKTRSGKIMRRILRKIAVGEIDNLGDVSTLAEPAVIAELIRSRENGIIQ